MERQARRYEDEAREAQLERQFQDELEEREAAEQEAEDDLRHDFQIERREWEKTRGFDLTQAEAGDLWAEYQTARRANPSTTFAEVVERDADRQDARIPNTSQDPIARRQRLAAHLEEAEQGAELAEAAREEEPQAEPASSDPRDEKARRAEFAAALEGDDD